MPVAATDLVAYASLNRPTADGTVSGGGIDVDHRVVFVDLVLVGGADTIEVLSSAAGDTTQTIVVSGRDATGALVTSSATTLNGTTPVAPTGLGTIVAVQHAILSADCAGTITIREASGDAQIATIPPGERGFVRLFRGAVTPGAGTDLRYEKFFWRNNHATLALLAASMTLPTPPANITGHAVETSVNGSAQVASRLTAPAGATAFGVAAITLATATGIADLAPLAAIGVWIRQSAASTDPAVRATWTSQLDGQSAP